MSQNIDTHAPYSSLVVVVAALLLTTVLTASTAAAAPAPAIDDEIAAQNESEDFRISPTVRLRPVETEITNRDAGIVELYVRNPEANDQVGVVDLTMSVPAGVQLSGSELGSGGGAGTVGTTIEVQPGSSRTVKMRVFPTEKGDFIIDSTLLYWPQDAKDAMNQFSYTHSFTVTGIPCPSEDTVGGSAPSECGGNTIPGGGLPEIPLSVIVLVAVLGLVTAVVVYARRSGAEIEWVEE
jgi:hypothetical protein